MQCRAHHLLRVTLWRRVSLRAVPFPTGNLRKQKFLDIWRGSAPMNEVRIIRTRDLPTCSTCSHVGSCTRCPGLAYMEGPSSQDCEKSLARTGILSPKMLL